VSKAKHFGFFISSNVVCPRCNLIKLMVPSSDPALRYAVIRPADNSPGNHLALVAKVAPAAAVPLALAVPGQAETAKAAGAVRAVGSAAAGKHYLAVVEALKTLTVIPKLTKIKWACGAHAPNRR
jgi:hypothetical protein